MRRGTNWIVGLMAAGVVCAITYVTMDASFGNILYNLAFLTAMILILLVGCGVGFGRMRQTQKGLDRATGKLKEVSEKGVGMARITSPGTAFFEVPYFDAKYQEYLHYLRKTNSPTDIGDYIGEYEINNYTHRRLVEMIPDILTSLGILGTFVGLVLGLRNFNPTSYESMATSVDSLIDGIKVAFVTSIYGISLSLAFSYWLRGALTGVSESLDRFLDAYYTTAVTPTDATAMNHIIANQNAQIKFLEQMQKDLADQLSQTISNNIRPMVDHLDKTMDSFTATVTLQQSQLLENISQRIARTMKQEFFSEFLEMRKVMGETNKVQRDHARFMEESEQSYQRVVEDGQARMQEVMEGSAHLVSEVFDAMHAQEEGLSGFVADLQRSMADIAQVNETNLKMTQQMDRLGQRHEEVAAKLTQLTDLSDRYTRSLAQVQADNTDLSEGLSVMNDSNIRIADRLAEMSDKTAVSLQEAQKAQKEYVQAADGYLKAIQTAQETLVAETRTQQDNLRQFTDYMTQVLASMKTMTDQTQATVSRIESARPDPSDQPGLQARDGASAQEQAKRAREAEDLHTLVALLKDREEREAQRDEAEAVRPRRRGLFGR